jgi:cysteine-rich repeat protein
MGDGFGPRRSFFPNLLAIVLLLLSSAPSLALDLSGYTLVYQEDFEGETAFPTTPEVNLLSIGPNSAAVFDGNEQLVSVVSSISGGVVGAFIQSVFPTAVMNMDVPSTFANSFAMRGNFIGFEFDFPPSDGSGATGVIAAFGPMVNGDPTAVVSTGIALARISSVETGSLVVRYEEPLKAPISTSIPLSASAVSAVLSGAAFTTDLVFDKTTMIATGSVDIAGIGEVAAPPVDASSIAAITPSSPLIGTNLFLTEDLGLTSYVSMDELLVFVVPPLIGDEVLIERSDTSSGTLQSDLVTVVEGAPEVACPGAFDLCSADIPGTTQGSFDIESDTLTLNVGPSGGASFFSVQDFNGYVFSDLELIEPITTLGLTTDIPGLTGSDLDFVGNSVSVNLAGLTVSPGQFFTVELNGTPPPAAGDVMSFQKVSDGDGYLSDPITPGNPGGLLSDGDRFGISSAGLGDLDGNGVDDIAVGAHFDGDGGVQRGAVYVLFLNADGTVKQRAKISDTQGNLSGPGNGGGELPDIQKFGTSIANLGDVNGDGVVDLAVGSANPGSVWILMLDTDASVKSKMRLADGFGGIPSGALPAEGFNFPGLAGVGDVNGDGIPDLVAGTTDADDGGTNRGALHVLFLRRNGSVRAIQTLSDTQGRLSGTGNPGGFLLDGDAFGVSATALGDLDGDGVTEIAVGAHLDDAGGTDRGAVYVLFLNRDGTVKPGKTVRITTGGVGGFGGTLDDSDRFGRRVKSVGDLDGDGVVDLAVSADRDDDGGLTDSGAVWLLFLTNTGMVSSETKLSAATSGFGGEFSAGLLLGVGLSALGDVNGDGVMDLGLGSVFDDTNGTNRGAMWNLLLEGTAVVCGNGVLDPVFETCDDGNVVPGDGCSASCEVEAKGGVSQGLSIFGSTTISHGDLTELGSDDQFAYALAAGDFNGDGVVDLAIGDPLDDTTVANGGAVHIVYGADSGPDPKNDASFREGVAGVAGVNEAGDQFGYALAVGDFDGDGYDDLAVGEPYETAAAQANAGAAVVLYGSASGLTAAGSSQWWQSKAGVLGSSEPGDNFGKSLAAGDFDGDGNDDLAIGVPGQTLVGQALAGAVHVLRGSSSGITDVGDTILGQDLAPIADTAEFDDRFGDAVAAGDFDGDGLDDIAIGTPGESLTSGVSAGGVNIIYGDATTLFDVSTAVYWTMDALGIGGAASDGFGAALTTCDFDGDGDDELAIGIPGRDDAGADAGMVLFALGSPSGLYPFSPAQLTGLAPAADSSLGGAITCADFTGDGRPDLAMSAEYDDAGGTDSGRVEVVTSDGSWPPAVGSSFTRSDLGATPNPGDLWGRALAGGDFDGNGFADLAIGMARTGYADGAVDIVFGGFDIDSDGDGLSDWEEENVHGTNPLDPDSDGDGFADGMEVDFASDPLDSLHIPFAGTAEALNADASTDASDFDGDVGRSGDLAAGTNGRWISVWTTDDDVSGTIGSDLDIVFATSNDSGATWSAHTPITSQAAGDSGSDQLPSIATDGAGNWIVVWESDEDLGGALGSDTDVLFSRSTDDGVTWSPSAPLLASFAGDADFDEQPRIATDEAGLWMASWVANGYEIHVATSSDAGASWSAGSAIAPGLTLPTLGPTHDLATQGAGTWIVGMDDGDNEIGFYRSMNGGASWTATLLTPPIGSGYAPHLATAPDGRWLATVNNSGGVDVWGSGDDGETWVQTTSLPLTYASTPDIAFDPSGIWIATASSTDSLGGWLGTDSDILVMTSSDFGSSWSEPLPWVLGADTDTASDDAVVIATDEVGHWVAMWRSRNDLGGTIGSDIDLLYTAIDGPDSDGDGLANAAELSVYGTDPDNADSDDDGLDDGEEVQIHGTDPLLIDSDGDGALDSGELLAGSDPLDAGNLPQVFHAPRALNSNAATDSTYDDTIALAAYGSDVRIAAWSAGSGFGIPAVSGTVLIARSLDRGATWGPLSVVTTEGGSPPLSGHYWKPALAVSPSGTCILAHWLNLADTVLLTEVGYLYVRRSSDGCATFDAPLTALQSTGPTSEPTATGIPAVATDGSGNWVLIWPHYDDLTGMHEIRASRSSDDGQSWSPQIEIAGPTSSPPLSLYESPRIITDGLGTWLAIWDKRSAVSDPREIYYSVSTNAGASWSAVTALSPDPAGESHENEAPDVAVDASGRFVATWARTDVGSLFASGDAAIVSSWSSDGGATWSPPVAVSSVAPGTGSPNISTDGSTWRVVWRSRDDVQGIGPDLDLFMAESMDGGLSWSSATVLNLDAAADADSEDAPIVIAGPDGDWVAAWSTPSDPGLGIGADPDILFTGSSGLDSDGDGLLDGQEGVEGTDPFDPDSDSDGLSDGDEIQVHGTDPLDPDSDDDGLTDGDEIQVYATDPLDPDSDDDGYGDAGEVDAGTDPNDPESFPPPPVPALLLPGLLALCAALGWIGWRERVAVGRAPS